MKELIVLAHCDAPDADCTGDVSELVVNGRTLDLCAAHTAQLWAPLARLIADAPPADGNRARDTHADRKPVTACLICGHPIAAMASHLAQQHSGAAMADVYGFACPLCGEEFGSSQSLGVHVSRRTDVIHDDVSSIVAAFAEAQRRGDPHGIVAARQSAARTAGR